MFEEVHNWEIGFIYYLQDFRTPALDSFFKFLNYFDTELFGFILIPTVVAFLGTRWGARILFLLTISSFLNFDFKLLFAQPRPTDFDPALGLFHFSNYGFPSGAAQTTMIMGGLGLLYAKSFASRLFFLAYIALISFSRLYLGVHFPTDILGGWALGLVILLGYIKYHASIEEWLSTRKAQDLIVLSVVIPLLLFNLYPARNTFYYACRIFGCSVSLIWIKDKLFSMDYKYIRALAGIAGVFLIDYLLKMVTQFEKTSTPYIAITAFKNFILPFWVFVAVPSLFEKLVRKAAPLKQ